MKLVDINPWAKDTGLTTRANLVREESDKLMSNGFLPLLWELHLNAFNDNVSGTEIFTTRGQNLSDDMATIWWEEATRIIKEEYPNHKWRPDYSDGDPDKEADFSVIKKSPCFGVLIEFYFFDHFPDVDIYMNSDGRGIWADTVLSAQNKINNMWQLGVSSVH